MIFVHIDKRVSCDRGAKVGGRATSCLAQKQLGRARRAEATRGGLSKGEVSGESRENEIATYRLRSKVEYLVADPAR